MTRLTDTSRLHGHSSIITPLSQSGHKRSVERSDCTSHEIVGVIRVPGNTAVPSPIYALAVPCCHWLLFQANAQNIIIPSSVQNRRPNSTRHAARRRLYLRHNVFAGIIWELRTIIENVKSRTKLRAMPTAHTLPSSFKDST